MSQTMREAIEEYGRAMYSAGMDAATWDRHKDAAGKEREAAEMLDALLSAPSSEQAQQGVEPAVGVTDALSLVQQAFIDGIAYGKHNPLAKSDEAWETQRHHFTGALTRAALDGAAPAAGVTDLARQLEALRKKHWMHWSGLENDVVHWCVQALSGAAIAGAAQDAGVASALAKHLRDAHAFIENTAAFGGTASHGILDCGGCIWNVDESKAALARHDAGAAQPAVGVTAQQADEFVEKFWAALRSKPTALNGYNFNTKAKLKEELLALAGAAQGAEPVAGMDLAVLRNREACRLYPNDRDMRIAFQEGAQWMARIAASPQPPTGAEKKE